MQNESEGVVVKPSRNLMAHNVGEVLPTTIVKGAGKIPSDISMDHVCGFKIPEFHRALDGRNNDSSIHNIGLED